MSNILTVCLVTANRPKEFREALLSLKKLHFQDFHLIIADDSSDNQSEVVAKELFPGATYFRNTPPLREILNSNKCIGLAETELVCLFHDDDVLEENYFDNIIPLMQQHSDIDLAFTGRIMVDQNNQELARQILATNTKEYIYDAADILDFMLFGRRLPEYRVFINTPGLVFRKSIFERSGGFDPSIDTHCDTDFLLKALSLSQKVLFINDPLYINKLWYGVSGRTKSSERGEAFEAQKGVLDHFFVFCEHHNIVRYKEHKKEIYTKFARNCTKLNGPLGWITFRFKGSYVRKVAALCKTAKKIVQTDPVTLLLPRFYFVFFGAVFTPKFIQKFIMKFLLKAYNRKS